MADLVSIEKCLEFISSRFPRRDKDLEFSFAFSSRILSISCSLTRRLCNTSSISRTELDD